MMRNSKQQPVYVEERFSILQSARFVKLTELLSVQLPIIRIRKNYTAYIVKGFSGLQYSVVPTGGVVA